MIDHTAMEAAAARRTQAYALLSAFYLAPPSADLAGIVSTEQFVDEANESLGQAARDFADAVREAAEGRPSVNELEAEHTYLFVLPSGVVPHESFYLDENKRLGGRVTAAVEQCYANAQANMTEQCLELADHVGVELEFMAFLCDLERQFWAASDLAGVARCAEVQRAFLEEHLLRWIRPLDDKVQALATLELYRALAHVTTAFMESERGHVSRLVEHVGPEARNLCEHIS